MSGYVYSGSMPILRLDENGEPIYYLTDAMGSVIGLADGNGAEIAEFEYDSFGNLRNSQGNDLGLTGGDFRFQGQWLESNTDLYHFRARYYDPESGRFISRDPVEIIEYEPESSNPYQFVYNNPHIYSDPSGEFTLTEVGASRKIQDILNDAQTYAYQEVKEQIIAKANQVVSDAIFDVMGNFLPLNSNLGNITNLVKSSMDYYGGAKGSIKGGLVFEYWIRNLTNNYFPENYLNYIYYEPALKLSGFAINSGYKPPENKFSGIVIEGTSRPDFIITSGRPRRHRSDGNRSWLIGDIKLSLRTVIKDYFGLEGQPPQNAKQWEAIHKYARKNGTYLASFVTLFDGGQNKQQLRGKLNKEAAQKGITVLVASILQNFNTSSNS
ncbi:RHS repeat domain-containing protein [Crocosphaera sp. Alani8]|uniref:RHS repeat domain-containing protein n=1 Tax=Crocosphaera sp. Alani8 TaxID=3038952 RepID=UPI00313C5294